MSTMVQFRDCDANTAITKTYIDYLSFDKFISPYDIDAYPDELLPYVSTCWVQHFSMSSSKLCDNPERFATSQHATFERRREFAINKSGAE
jgi:hypothetical protein